MGNKISEDITLQNYNNYGEIDLILEKNEFLEGEQINGILKINLIEDFPDNKIKILIIGFEENLFNYKPKDSKNYSNSNIVFCKGNNVVINQISIIHENKDNKIFQKGKYGINFSIMLPLGIPNSFEKKFIVDKKEEFGKIYYHILGGLSTDDKKINFLAKSNINIFEKYKYDSLNKIKTKSLNIDNCSCFNIGNCKINLEINNNFFKIGDKILVKILIDNTENDHKIDNLNIILYKKIVFFYNQYANIYDLNIFKKTITSIKPKEKIDEPFVLDIATGDINENELSVNSDLIECNYFIKVELENKKFFNCGKIPHLKLPFIVTKVFNKESEEIVKWEANLNKKNNLDDKFTKHETDSNVPNFNPIQISSKNLNEDKDKVPKKVKFSKFVIPKSMRNIETNIISKNNRIKTLYNI